MSAAKAFAFGVASVLAFGVFFAVIVGHTLRHEYGWALLAYLIALVFGAAVSLRLVQP